MELLGIVQFCFHEIFLKDLKNNVFTIFFFFLVQCSEALVDFSGGCAEHYDLKEEDSKEIYDLMMKAYEKTSMMACSMEPDPRRTEVRIFLKLKSILQLHVGEIKYFTI